MLKVEVVCHTDTFVEVQDFLYYCSSVIAVCGMVDVAAFHHHEKLVGRYFFQVVETSRGELLQCQGTCDAVDGIADFVRGYRGMAGEQHLVADVDFAECIQAVGNGESVGTVVVKHLFGFFFALFRNVSAGSAQEIEAAFCTVGVDFFIHASVNLMGIEGCGGCIVVCYGSDKPHAVALSLQLGGNAGNGNRVGCHAYHSVLGLVAGCKGGAGGRRVGYRTAGGVGHCH